MQQRLNPTALMVAAAFGALTSLAHANPEGGKVVNGQASITSHGNTLVVKNTPGAIINWQSFSIGAGQITDFVQQSVNSAILNRVVGANPSVILGTLESNGHVFLVNPNGVVFGKGATVDAAGLVVSSLNITDEDFKNGTLRFVGSDAAGDISVAGVLRSSDGDVYLIAPNVTNSGSITATNGAVVLAAGQDVEILGSGLNDIQFNVQNKSNTALNLGQINGDAVGIFAGTLTQAGGVSATTATVTGGKVVLSALGDVALASGSSTTADNASGTGGSISLQSVGGNISVASGAGVSASGATGGTITLLTNGGSDSVTGSMTASGTMGLGGSVDVLGQSVALGSTAALDASGSAGGGQIVVGGLAKSTALLQSTATSVAAGALLSADATGAGDGGHVVVFGQNTMDMDGSISAKGGALGGNGGLIETSGEIISIGDGAIAANARAAGGKAGTWLLDPGAVDINTTGYDASGGSNGTASMVAAGSIANALNGGTSVTIATSNVIGAAAGEADSITVSSAINATTVQGNAALTLSAGGDIFVNAGITAIGGATLNMKADLEGSGGNIAVNAPIYLPGGSVLASGEGFTNNNTITALNVTAYVSPNGGAAPAGFKNLGVIDASGQSNNSNSGGVVYVNSSETVPVVLSGTISADAYPGGGGAGGSIQIINAGPINVSGATLTAQGGSGSFGGDGGQGGAIALSAAGALTVSGVTSMSVMGGDGNSTLSQPSGSGGTGGTISLVGSSVSVTGAVLDASGGAGGTITNPTAYALAGSGGFGGGISIQGVAGGVTMMDTTASAAGGSSLGGGGDGGTGGTINISALGAISIIGGTYMVSGGGGGNGLASPLTVAYSDGGYGGDGGTISITGSSVSIGAIGDATTFAAIGGTGGTGANGTDANGTALAGDASFGGDGGYGGGISISSLATQDSGTIALTNAVFDVSGSLGAPGGTYYGTNALQHTAGGGGYGGNGGMILINGSGEIDITNSTIASNGGVGGAGGALTGFDIIAAAGSGGNGGTGGQIDISNVDAAGAYNVTILGSTLNITGGNGGNGGAVANNAGAGGNGGVGGDAGGPQEEFNALPSFSPDVGALGIAINITATGILTIDGASTLTVQGGNGGAGTSTNGVNPSSGISIAPGNGGNGGTAGSIWLESTDAPDDGSTTLNVAATINVIGGNGGAGGNLLNGSIANNGGTIAAGNGGTGGDGGAYNGNNGALNMYADSGALSFTGVINVNGGNGGAGGNTADSTFGPGNGGAGGAAAYVYSEADGGALNFGGVVNMSGGSGGNGGSVPTTSANLGGSSGSSGYTDGLGLDAYGTGNDVILSGTINYNAGFEGNPGSNGANGDVGSYGNYNGVNGIYLYSDQGNVTQNGGAITSDTGTANVNVSAALSVDLESGDNNINSIAGTALNGYIAVDSNQALFVFQNLSATSTISLQAPELGVFSPINAGGDVTLTATGGTLYINQSVTSATMYIDSNVSGQDVNLSANGLLTLDSAGNIQVGTADNPGIATLDVVALNVFSGAQFSSSSSGEVSVQSYNNGPIYLTGDSYSNGNVSALSSSELILGAEFFGAVNLSSIQVGNTQTPSISLQSFSGGTGTIAIAQGDTLSLSAQSISNDSLTTLSTDNLNVVSNSANLSGIVTTTVGGTMTLAASAINSGATLSVSMAPGQSMQVGDTDTADPFDDFGISGYQSVTLSADVLHLTDTVSLQGGSAAQLTLGATTPGTLLALGGTGYSWDLGQNDINDIQANGGALTIGTTTQAGPIVVQGPVYLGDINANSVTLTTSGTIALQSGYLSAPSSAVILVGGSGITDAGAVVVTGASIRLYSDGSIGTPTAPVVVNTGGEFGATSYGGAIAISGQSNLYTLSDQGVTAAGDVSIVAPIFVNYGTVSGVNVAIDGTVFENSGTVQASGVLNVSESSAATDPGTSTTAVDGINLTGSSQLNLQGTISSQGALNLTGGDIALLSSNGLATVLSGSSVSITGGSLAVTGMQGGTASGAAYSTEVYSTGTLNVTLSGNMTVDGGNTSGGSAALISVGDSIYQIGGNLNMSGGSANGAFALLDPLSGGTPGSTMSITANQINLTGGSAANAYAAIVAEGNILLTGIQQVTLNPGSTTNPNSDSVVVSKVGTITAVTPDCVNCTPQMGSNPLLNSDTNEGFYGDVAAAPPPAAAPPAAPPPAPAPPPVVSNDNNGLGDPANDTLIQDLITLWDIPLDAQAIPPINGLIFVDGGVDGCF